MRRISARGVLSLLRVNFRLAVKTSLLLATAYLLMVPLVRGISNLDAVHSAECLEQAVILIGIFLIVPLSGAEQSSEALEEVVRARKVPYWIILGLRLILSVLCIVLMVMAFAGIMKWQNCTFPLAVYVTGTVITAMALGCLGFAVSVLTRSVVTGYLASFGYYFLNSMGSLSSSNPFYLFSMENGNYVSKAWLLTGSLLLIAIALIWTKKRK